VSSISHKEAEVADEGDKFNKFEPAAEKFHTPTDDDDAVEAHKYEPAAEKFQTPDDDDGDVEAHKF
jgi:hypothetical protein